jgi:MraZ protein
MFSGEYRHSLDKKNRLIIPSKFREILSEKYEDKFILTRGLDHCIFLYPPDEWRELERKARELTLTKKDNRDFRRMLISGAVDCVLDKQGRIMVPKNLQEHAAIKKDVIIIGNIEKAEIWSKENWQGHWGTAKTFEELAEQAEGVNL